LEFTLDLREEPSSRADIAPIVRSAVMEFVQFSGLS
jgi:hypothetical protein